MNNDERYVRFMSRLGWAILFAVVIDASMPAMSLGHSWLKQYWQPINRELVQPSSAEKEGLSCVFEYVGSQESQMTR